MLRIDNVSVTLFSDGINKSSSDTSILKNISFNVNQGEHLSVVGHSGSGKSTLLKAIYGLLSLESGQIFYNNKLLLGPEHFLIPGYEFMKYLAQDLGIMPFISVRDNVGDFLSNFYPKKKKQKVDQLLELVGLSSKANVHVRYLSGGQKQRVALAKVLALEPQVLLLDEPFSQIDQALKSDLRHRIFTYLKNKNITCITVTHQVEDILGFADRVLVLKNGKQVAFDQTDHLVFNPYDRYISQLFFTVNEISAHLLNLDLKHNYTQNVLLYPWEIVVKESHSASFIVDKCFFSGSHYHIRVVCGGWSCTAHSQRVFSVGQRVIISCNEDLFLKRIELLFQK